MLSDPSALLCFQIICKTYPVQKQDYISALEGRKGRAGELEVN